MRQDLSITYDDYLGTHYLNFDRIIGQEYGVDTGGYIGVRASEDGRLYVVVIDKEGDVVTQCDVPISQMIGD